MTRGNSFASLSEDTTKTSREDKRVHRGRVVFGAMDEVEKIKRALGGRCAAIFDAMPQHTPREAVIAAAAQARDANADLIVTVGGGSITDGAKAVQLCLANDI